MTEYSVIINFLLGSLRVKNKDDDVAKRAALLFCFQKEGVLKFRGLRPRN